MAVKIRLDKLLVEKNLAPSRERAQAYILAGHVLINQQCFDKPGTLVDSTLPITLKQKDHPFVSRGGVKLEHALQQFNLSVKNSIALDVGASTGGFTDCLLQHGAAIVYAVDVGYGQLAWELRQNPRVKNIEKTNFRQMTFNKIGTFVDLVVIDASFISLRLLLQKAIDFLVTAGHLIALIKPQFEAGKDQIAKGGVVNNEQQHLKIIQDLQDFAENAGLTDIKIIPSPIFGKKKKNREFLMIGKKSRFPSMCFVSEEPTLNESF